jgi:kanamycin kinase
MKLTSITINIDDYPADFHTLLSDATLYDSSCSEQARVIFIDKDGGFFLKSAPKQTLQREAAMTKYFHSKNLAANLLAYISEDKDWLLTEKLHGEDGISPKHLEKPEQLCDIFAERLALLHSERFTDCPIPNHTELYLAKAEHNMRTDNYDKSNFPDSFGYKSAEEAWSVVEAQSHCLNTNTLLHGDYCLPNIILNDWKFGGFIDLDHSGVGDRHVDIFWATWTLYWNLHTHDYRDRFISVYGKDRVDEDMLRVVAAVEVFL